MIQEEPLPGDKGFFVVKNSDIYLKLNELERFVTQLKTALYLISFIVTPAVSALVASLVSSIGA